MDYIDGYVVPVPRARLADYKKLARAAGKIWLEHGALEVVESVADDVEPGVHTSFPQAVQLRDDEVVVFSWIRFRSRRERDRVNAAVHADARMGKLCPEDPARWPFDGQRMFWGGFKPVVSLARADD